MLLVWETPGSPEGRMFFWARLEPGAEGIGLRPTPSPHPTLLGTFSPALDSTFQGAVSSPSERLQEVIDTKDTSPGCKSLKMSGWKDLSSSLTSLLEPRPSPVGKVTQLSLRQLLTRGGEVH